MPTLAQFNAIRKPFETQYFAAPNLGPHTRTVMVPSHIWWTEHLALALLNAGHNVLLHFALYLLYTDDELWRQFDHCWNMVLQTMRQHQVDLIVAGNSTALMVHPKTGELLHQAAKVPMVHYWWDEPRTRPPFGKRLPLTPEDYLRFLRDPATLNVIWDRDVLEELGEYCQITNTLHVPLATLPEMWPDGYMPLENRPLAACFLGNCHAAVDWIETDADPLAAWARQVVTRKIADLDRPMAACLREAGAIPRGESAHLAQHTGAWEQFTMPWDFLNTAYMHRTRNEMVKAVAGHIAGKLALIGKGWEALKLRANSEHALDKTGLVYGLSKASLNLSGGCVHGGMPLRPFDIAASSGLLLTHYQRELPELFEPGRECLAFRNAPEMLEHLDHILARPADYNGIAQAGRARVRAEHTWSRRVEKVLAAAEGLRF